MADGLADLSYRNYDGPRHETRFRWWIIARKGIMAAFKNKWTWIMSLLASWYFLFLIAFLYILEQSLQAVSAGGTGGGNGDFAERLFARIIWKDQFLTGLGSSQLLFFVIALIIGSGAIANDNRSMALLVYLSRPLKRWDYLFGKWLGVFIPMLVAMILPTGLFYFYGALNLAKHGFLADDPWLVLRLAAWLPIMAGFYTSLIVGASSLVKQPRLAGGLLAALYFVGYMFSTLMRSLLAAGDLPEGLRGFIEQATYWSIPTLMQGLGKLLLDTKGSPPFGAEGQMPAIAMPHAVPLALVLAGFAVVSLLVAAARVKAVEVVR